MSRPIGWTKPKIKPCRICGNPVVPVRRKDRNAFWYPRQCKSCKGKCRNNTLRIERLKQTISSRRNPHSLPVGSRHLHVAGHDCIYWQVKIAEPSFWMFEHRFIMEQILGRKLKRSEFVHHKDDDSLNNIPSNLQLTSIAPHNRHHFTIFTWAKDFAECRCCHSTQYSHLCHGLCKHCYAYLKWHQQLNEWIR